MRQLLMTIDLFMNVDALIWFAIKTVSQWGGV